MTIHEAAFFLIFQNIQLPKLVLHTKNESTKMEDIIKRCEVSQSAFLKSLNLPAGTPMIVIVVFNLQHFCQETR